MQEDKIQAMHTCSRIVPKLFQIILKIILKLSINNSSNNTLEIEKKRFFEQTQRQILSLWQSPSNPSSYSVLLNCWAFDYSLILEGGIQSYENNNIYILLLVEASKSSMTAQVLIWADKFNRKCMVRWNLISKEQCNHWYHSVFVSNSFEVCREIGILIHGEVS